MAQRLKFFVEQWAWFVVRWQVRRFENFKLARHFRIESSDSNFEASQIPTLYSSSVWHIHWTIVKVVASALLLIFHLVTSNLVFSTAF